MTKILIRDDGSAESVEPTANLTHHHVAHDERDLRVDGINVPRSGDEARYLRTHVFRSHSKLQSADRLLRSQLTLRVCCFSPSRVNLDTESKIQPQRLEDPYRGTQDEGINVDGRDSARVLRGERRAGSTCHFVQVF